MDSMRKLRGVCLFSILLVSLFFSSCTNRFNPHSKRQFLRHWSYSLDNQNFVDLPDGPMGSLHNYVPGHKGLIILKTEFDVPWELLAAGDAGLALGKIEIASRIYVNARQVAETGLFPPEEFYSGQAYTNIRLNPDMLRFDGKNELIIHLYVDGSGGISDCPFISTYEDTSSLTGRFSFLFSKLNLIFSFCMVLISISYMMIYAAHKKDKEYKDYALMNFWTAFYLVPMWIAEAPVFMGMFNLLWWCKFLEGVVAFFTAHCASSFILSFLKIKQSKRMMITRWVMLAVAVIIDLAIPSLVIFNRWKILIYVLILVQLSPAILILLRNFKAKKKEIFSLLLGFSPAIISVIADVILKGVARLEMVPLTTVYGWQVTTITFMAIVTRRYSVIRKSFEYLNDNLEKEVQERTDELRKTNEVLAIQNDQAKKDMELAVHVQKMFYPQDLNFLGWDVAVNFEPLSGVSGDLYDFYVLEGKLRGFGLFDVSGHGISSGLITMLAKNTIFQNFRETLPLKLSEAALITNDALIRAKGEVENYLTGCLFRIDSENPRKIEFINAGGPHPVYKQKKKSPVFMVPDENKPQYGMFGVKNLKVEFQTIKQTVKTGDVLVLYTDGLTEAENVKGEAFGKERLLDALEKVSGSAQEILDSLMIEFKEFIGPNVLEDDITVIVLKRVDESIEKEDEFGTLEMIEDPEL